MATRSPFHRFLWVHLVVTSLASASFGAPRFFIDSRSTTLDPGDTNRQLIYREMPRQALIVSATEDFGVMCVDPTVEPTALPRQDDARLGLDRKVNAEGLVVTISLFDAQNQSLGSFEIPQKANAGKIVLLDDYAARCDEMARTQWRPILSKQLGIAAAPARWDASLRAPDEVERLLGSIDFVHAFLAARLTHQAIRESGESPARLGALVRAYAHLGDATRHLVAGQSVGFFARSLMYAQRLVRLAPDDPSALRHRAYAQALFGITHAAQSDLDRADQLERGKPAATPPDWVPLTRGLLAFDTIALFQKVNDPNVGAMATYFAWLTVEHSLLQSLPIRFGQLAIERNPGAVRVIDAVAANAGVSLNHEVTQQSSLLLNRLVASLATDPAAPPPVQTAVQQAVETRFAIPSVLALLEAFDRLPEEPRQPIQWSTLASLVREGQFTNAVRRLTFVTHLWNVDPTAERNGWLALVGNHRYGAFVESFGPPDRPPDAALVEKVRAIDFKDDSMSANVMIRHLDGLRIRTHPKYGTSWTTWQRQQSGNTAYDAAQSIWRYRFGDLADPAYRAFFRREATFLNAVRPDHPLALTVLLTTDWPTLQDRAAQIEQFAPSNPLLAYGLGRAYAAAGKTEPARNLLELAANHAPDRAVYEQLADTYLALKDERGWLNAWDTYLRTSEDFALDHAKVSEQIAYHLCGLGDLANATRYAERSAQSGSAWGMDVYAHVLLRQRQYDEAGQLVLEIARRYNRPGRLYRFMQTTGRGEPAAVKRAYETQLAAYERAGNDPAALRDAAIFYALEANHPKAIQLMQRSLQLTRDPFSSALLASFYLEQKQPDQARATLDAALAALAAPGTNQNYTLCMSEMRRLIANPTAPPSRDGGLGELAAANEQSAAVRGNACYFLGRIAELRQQPDDAIWWYRAALDADIADFSCRPLAAIALRKMGKEYYN